MMTAHRRQQQHAHCQRQYRRRMASAEALGLARPWRVCDLWRHTSANHCGLCGGVIYDRAHASIDHILPLSLGGGEDEANIQLAHKMCNWRKGNNQPTETTCGAATPSR